MQQKIPTVIITGAGLGGLSFYHALIKNKDKKEFNVKIFERESGPQDRWQGYHIGINNFGARSLINCLPSSVASNLQKGMPNPIPDVECHGFSLNDHMGNLLLKPPSKQAKDVYGVANASGFSAIITYRDRLRDVLLENVPVQWGKKCIGYEETEEGVWVFFEDGSKEFCDILVGADGINSPVRKQKIPELQIFDFGITQINADVAVPKNLIDRFIRINGNSLFQKTLGLNGDATFIIYRLIPIEQEQEQNDKNEPHYRTTLAFSYPTKLDDNVENDKIKVDDNDPASVIDHAKHMIRKLRPECELTNIMLELWSLVPRTAPDSDKYPFKTYNPVQRRQMQDINPLSVNEWTSSRVTLLGDAAHAMSPVLGLGANNAIQDADVLSQALLNYSPENYISCIKEYENEMLKRTSADKQFYEDDKCYDEHL
ncbi:FAD/NAD(P)-binding domain-containing protein [Rhizophagus irregularis]|uniref:FAD/NAD(P)-binding domain-containing protein n=1 Tax=Rhizophagus irregularis TaxID=588596 RepID=A0A2I1EB65_9GLOM|nr:FAD/NAD(P)-binding domain-containing protein [Rhizophagus irregularis]PKY19378.1 FAD/NAD(P)-binding domain-containing protein [Rhizophagus irregularis]CAG8625613.1 19578_t:CDS:2 [Rhizophagus irregularis]